MLQSDACRIKEKKNITNEKPAATWSQGFFCCLTPPQITLFVSLLLKTKVQHREIKNAIWSFYFQVSGSSSFSCLALSVLIPVTSCPCWPWGDWQGSVCIPSTLESRWNLAPDKQAAGNFPSTPSLLNIYRYLPSWLDHQGWKTLHQGIPTSYCLFSSSFFSLLRAAVSASPF